MVHKHGSGHGGGSDLGHEAATVLSSFRGSRSVGGGEREVWSAVTYTCGLLVIRVDALAEWKR